MGQISINSLLIVVMLVIGIVLFIVGCCADMDYFKLLGGITVFVVIATVIFHIPMRIRVQKEVDEYKKTIEKTIEDFENGAKLYVDGEPVSDDFDIHGIDLNDFKIKIEDDKIYLMKKGN